MEKLAYDLRKKIDNICGGYHYFKDENVLPRAKELAGEMEQFCNFYLQGNQFGMEETEYQEFYHYVIQILKDYIEALQQQDMVLMLDTLDYGFRELLNIYIDAEESGNEQRDLGQEHTGDE